MKLRRHSFLGLKRKPPRPAVNPLTKLHFVSANQLQLEKDIAAYRAQRDARKRQGTTPVQDVRVWCDRCLASKAKNYSPVFNQRLCLGCLENLECAAGAEVFERMKRKGKTSEAKSKKASR